MKKIQKEIVRTEYQTVYVALDGTEFISEEECKKYDNSAKCVLMAKYNKLVVKESDESEIIGIGCEDDVVQIAKIESQNDADLILQIVVACNDYYHNEEHKKDLESVRHRIQRALYSDGLLVIGRNYDMNEFWVMDSRKGYIDKVNKFFTIEKTDDSE